MEPLKIILLFLGIYSKYVEANICLTWETEQNKLFLKCKVNKLLWGVYFYDPSNNQQGFCSFPIPSPNCFPNSSMQQDLRTNTTTLMIITGGIDSNIDGQWKCLHGRNLDEGVVDITVIKEGKSNEEKLGWIFIGCLLCVLVILSVWILKQTALPTVRIQSSTYTGRYGNSVTLVCTVSAVPFQTNVYWEKDGFPPINSGDNRYSGSTTNNPSLTINSVTTSDQGTYRCYATNIVGKGQSSTTQLTVSGELENTLTPKENGDPTETDSLLPTNGQDETET